MRMSGIVNSSSYVSVSGVAGNSGSRSARHRRRGGIISKSGVIMYQ